MQYSLPALAEHEIAQCLRRRLVVRPRQDNAALFSSRIGIDRHTEMLIAAAVIFGGLLLRYVVVVAGQITGPVGL